MVERSGTGALERVRAARLAEAASQQRGWDLARLPARRGEEPIEAAIDRLWPTFMEVAMADVLVFARKGGYMPAGSTAGALGARSRSEMSLYVADWILRADLHHPQLQEQDAPLADRHRMFEAVCRQILTEMTLATSGRRPISWSGLAVLIALVLVLLGIYAHYDL